MSATMIVIPVVIVPTVVIISGTKSTRRPPPTWDVAAWKKGKVIVTLGKRYAKGEISGEEYLVLTDDLKQDI